MKVSALAVTDGLDLISAGGLPTNTGNVGGTNMAYAELFTMATAGDVNGDGYDDIEITSRTMNSPDVAGTSDSAGVTYILYGGQYGTTGAARVDLLGGSGNDNLVGTSADEQFVAGIGNDTLVGNGGADAMSGGAGNDTFVLNASNVTALSATTGAVNARVNGGTGLDVFKLDGAGITLDLTALPTSVIKDVEHFDISGSGANTLKLGLKDVVNLGSSSVFDVNTAATDVRKQLMVTGDSDDKVQLTNLTSEWTQAGPYSNSGHVYSVYNHNTSNAQLLIDQALQLQNV